MVLTLTLTPVSIWCHDTGVKRDWHWHRCHSILTQLYQSAHLKKSLARETQGCPKQYKFKFLNRNFTFKRFILEKNYTSEPAGFRGGFPPKLAVCRWHWHQSFGVNTDTNLPKIRCWHQNDTIDTGVSPSLHATRKCCVIKEATRSSDLAGRRRVHNQKTVSRKTHKGLYCAMMIHRIFYSFCSRKRKVNSTCSAAIGCIGT